MRLPYRARGAARIAAGLGDADGELPDAVIDQALRSELGEENIHVAWEIARLPRDLSPRERIALCALVLVTQDAVAQGSTRVALEGDLDDRARALGMDDDLRSDITSLIARGSPEILGVPGDARPLIVEGGYLYQQRLHALELRLANALRAHLSSQEGGRAIEGAIETIRARPSHNFTPNDEQERAIEVALREPLSVISGGPGTGKTSVVVAILRAEMARGELLSSAIALAAPTGKAADRLRTAIHASLASVSDPLPSDRALRETLAPPRTLHRLLGFSPHRGTFHHGSQSPLSERLVIVDESSMIDVYLMERLLSSLRRDARLVLLGDAEQLPSVAAGAVFRDLAQSDRVPSARLTRNYRMDPSRPDGFNVVSVAARINEGHTPPRVATAIDKSGKRLPVDLQSIGAIESLEGELGGVLHLDVQTPVDRERFLSQWYERFVRADAALIERSYRREGARIVEEDGSMALTLFDRAERHRLLGVTRGEARATGAQALALALHRRHAEALQRTGPRWIAGEPVLVSRNDYERGLFNGDQGLLLWTRQDESPRLSAVFRREDGLIAHPLDLVRPSLELGFATTVHKAQGSEHDVVALVLPDGDLPRLLTREIVYTALTRARRAVVIVGDLDLVRRAAKRRVIRSTGVSERIGS